MTGEELLRETMPGGYIQVWMIEPPAQGIRYRVLQDEWSEEPGTGTPVRRIYQIKISRGDRAPS